MKAGKKRPLKKPRRVGGTRRETWEWCKRIALRGGVRGQMTVGSRVNVGNRSHKPTRL